MNHDVKRLERRLRSMRRRPAKRLSQPSQSIWKNRWWITIFMCALRGIGFVFATQRNMKIHVVVGSVIIALGVFLQISRLEWIALSFSIALILMAEMINTAVEVTIDLVTKKISVRAMIAKDIAAGAVLILALNAIVVGSLIFVGRAYTLFSGG